MDPKGGPDASGLSDCCTEISDLKLKQEKCCSETRTNNLGLESDLEDLEDPVLCTRHMQRRLSCEEVENVLEKLRQLMATPLDLPENDGKVLDCHLLKELSPLDADKMIDDTFNKLEDWLKHQRQALKRHLSSHRFVVSTDISPALRDLSDAALKLRHDSGICSQEVPYNIPIEQRRYCQINPLKEEQLNVLTTRENSPPRSEDEDASGECNQCFSPYDTCRCRRLTEDQDQEAIDHALGLLDQAVQDI